MSGSEGPSVPGEDGGAAGRHVEGGVAFTQEGLHISAISVTANPPRAGLANGMNELPVTGGA